MIISKQNIKQITDEFAAWALRTSMFFLIAAVLVLAVVGTAANQLGRDVSSALGWTLLFELVIYLMIFSSYHQRRKNGG